MSRGRAPATVDHLVALTRIAAHGPPAATDAAVEFVRSALKPLRVNLEKDFVPGGG